MAPTKQPLRAVRSWYEANQGTGESPFRQTEDGRVWRDARSYELDGSLTLSGEIRQYRDGWIR